MKHAIAASYLGILDKCLKKQGMDGFLNHLHGMALRIEDPQAYLSLAEFNEIVARAYQYSQLPHLGLLFGEQLSIANHGFLGYATMTSPTLKAAIETMLQFIATRTKLLSGQLKKDNIIPSSRYIELDVMPIDATNHRFLTEMAIAHLIKIKTFLLNKPSLGLKLEIDYPEPAYKYFYKHFASEVVFNAPITKIFFSDEELSAAINFADDLSYQQAKLQISDLKAHLSQEDDLPYQIKHMLYTQDLSKLSMAEVAKQLCMSIRTLRRRLLSFSLTYQHILDEIREKKACDLLLNTSLSITEISFLLGFKELSNFTKAFKRWNDMTPSEYRKHHSKAV